MEIKLTSDALNDLQYWKKTGNTQILKRVKQLLEAIQSAPFHGIGKPEGLKGNLPASGRGELIRNTDWYTP